MLRSFLLCTLIVAACHAEEDIKTEDEVLVLGDENFKKATTENQYILVEFYAPWCGHCKALAPEYAKAAKALLDEGSSIKLGKVDATVESKLAEDHGVRGYPTIKFFKDGKALEYSGGRTGEEIVQWLKKKTGPPATTLKTAEEAKKAKDDHEVCVVGCFKDVASDDAKVFMQAAEDIELPMYITSEQAVYDELECKSDGVVLLKKFDDKRNEYDGKMVADDIKAFVVSNSLPLIIDFNQDNAQKIFGGDIKSHHLLFVGKSHEKYAEIQKYYSTIAKEFKGRILCVVIDTDDEEHGRITEFFGITKEELPTNRIIELHDDMTKFKPETTEINEENIKKFISDVLEKRLKPHLLSQDVPEDWDKQPVKVLVSKNFDEVAHDKTKDVLVEFYAPWCGHCKQLDPIYKELAEKMASRENLVIAKMDATVNELEHTKIQSFPTIKLYKKETNEIVEYNGERTLEGLTKFIESDGVFGQAAEPDAEEEEEPDLGEEEEEPAEDGKTKEKDEL